MDALVERLRRSPLAGVARSAWLSGLVKRLRHAASRERRNAVLEDRHLGERCFIIGNGPSILTQDLTLLRDEVVFCLNSFFHHEQLHEIAPNYLCAQDPELLAPAQRQRWHQLHEERDTRAITMLFNVAARRRDRRLGLFGDHTVHYVYAGSEVIPPMWERDTFPVDLTRPLATYGLVLTDIALPAALYMGCKEIVLLGFDASEVNSFDDYVNYNFYGQDPLFSMERYRADYERFFGAGAENDSKRAGLWERSLPCIERTLAAHGAKWMHANPVEEPLPGIPRVSWEDVVAGSGASR